MASRAKSRWADSEEDTALEARIKQEKEEKRRLKAEKARKLEVERQAQTAAEEVPQNGTDGDSNGRPTKRRKLTPEHKTRDETPKEIAAEPARLLRFETGYWSKSRSVENFDKLNDIEEGTYGWVARAKEIATGKVVALKRLKLDGNDRNGLPVTGLREIQILKDCDHRNIVKLQEVVVGEDAANIERYAPCAYSFPLLPG
jgi:cell division cycle 2-like